jgi:hypothetical protein
MVNLRRCVLATLAGAALATGCAGPSTTIEQSWKAPRAGLHAPRNVLVVYVSRDGTIRRSAEDKMVSRLVRYGVLATPSYAVLTDDELRDRARAKGKLTAAGYDGVIVIRPISTEPAPLEHHASLDDFWDGGATYDAGYGYSDVVVRVETNVYSLHGNELLWSVLSRTIEPQDVSDVVDDVTTLVSKELKRDQIVLGTRTPATTARRDPAGGAR